ncbi:hypothetical protein FVEN_g12912 [Fusarium venenatum]|nr:hypothetical protein FVEN_g12912 [Fusarium venenatum]
MRRENSLTVKERTCCLDMKYITVKLQGTMYIVHMEK